MTDNTMRLHSPFLVVLRVYYPCILSLTLLRMHVKYAIEERYKNDINCK